MSDFERELADRLFSENKTHAPFHPVRDSLRPATMEAGYQVQTC